MLALRLSIFDPEHEVKTAQEIANYSSALFSTYELAVLIYPDQILTSAQFPGFYAE